MIHTPWSDRSLGEWAAGVRNGETLAAELTDRSLAAIEQLEPDVRAWVALNPHSRDEAKRIDDEAAGGPVAGLPAFGPLSGIPVGVKDIIDVAGLPTRCGSPITSAEPVVASAGCVDLLRTLGAVVIGKTVTTEFAYFKPGPTDNPAAPGHTPGGSSSGSAAAVAAGMVPLAIGSQTAGSLTRPAAFCGVAGMVLTPGAVDLSGISGLSPTLDSLGIIARNVADLAYVHEALTGTAPEGAQGRILVWRGSGLDRLSPAMTEAVECVDRRLRSDGRPVADLDWDDHIRTLVADHITIMSFEAARERGDILKQIDQLSAPLAELLLAGQQVTPADYEAALIRRARSFAELSTALRGTDVIVGPAALGPAPAGHGATGSPILSRPWQLLGLPVVTVPGVRSGDGRPLGLQVIGLPGSETSVLAVAERLELLVSECRTESPE